MKKLLVGFIMDGKSGGIDKYLLNFLTKVSNEEVRIDFLTNEIDIELQTELKKFHSNLYAIANLKNKVRGHLCIKLRYSYSWLCRFIIRCLNIGKCVEL